MWSRIVSLVDDLNYEDEDDYESDIPLGSRCFSGRGIGFSETGTGKVVFKLFLSLPGTRIGL